MKITIIAVLALLIIGGGVYFVANGSDSVSDSQAVASQRNIPSQATLLDVRTAEEFSAGHGQGASHLSLQDIQNGSMPDVPKDQEIFVYCRSGNRSAVAAGELKKAGYTNVKDIGGLQNLASWSVPIVK